MADGIFDSGSFLDPSEARDAYLVSLASESSSMRTKVESLIIWKNQQEGSEKSLKWWIQLILPIFVAGIIGLASFLYVGVVQDLKEIARDFQEYKLKTSEEIAILKNRLDQVEKTK